MRRSAILRVPSGAFGRRALLVTAVLWLALFVGVPVAGACETSFCFPDATHGYRVVVGHTIAASTDGGTTWAQQLYLQKGEIYDLCFADAATGWAVGHGGFIAHTSDGGATWTEQVSGTTDTLRAVTCIDGQRAWAVGACSIIATTDGGATWTDQTGSGEWIGLRAVDFVGETFGVAVGECGKLMRTTDGGATWVTIETQTIGRPRDVWFADAANGWVAGKSWDYSTGLLARTTDGGLTWSAQASPKCELFDIAASSPTARWVAGGGTCETGGMLSSTDAGLTWAPVPAATLPGSFYGVDFPDSLNGWAAILWQDAAMRTTDGGVSWTEQPWMIADTVAPTVVAAWRAEARRGQRAAVRYRVDDPLCGWVKVTIRIKDASGRVVRILREGASTNTWPSCERTSWLCKLPKGTYRFAVYATDGAGNKQVQAASNRLTVR